MRGPAALDRRFAARLTVAVGVIAVVSACTTPLSDGGPADPTSESGGTAGSQGVYGATTPGTDVGAEPSDVATDPPRQTDDASRERLVVITSAGWDEVRGAVEVGGFVDVVEDGGTCTVSLTNAATSVTASGAALPDAATTSCGFLAVPGDRLAPGEWEAQLSYQSGTSTGVSDAVLVQVP